MAKCYLKIIPYLCVGIFALYHGINARVLGCVYHSNPAFNYDSSDWKSVSFSKISMGDCSARIYGEHIITSDSAFQTLLNERWVYFSYSDYEPPQIDFSKYTLIISSKFADCNARFHVEIFKNDKLKSFQIITREFYGGCRGLNLFADALIISKEENYTFEFVYPDDTDYSNGRDQTAFEFVMRLYEICANNNSAEWKNVLSEKFRNRGDEYINNHFGIWRDKILKKYDKWYLSQASIKTGRYIEEGESTVILINEEAFAKVKNENGEIKIDEN
ncbi:MAG: hypothetical protein V1720_08460 [bacterium]